MQQSRIVEGEDKGLAEVGRRVQGKQQHLLGVAFRVSLALRGSTQNGPNQL
jgi:hypothetical protein